LLGVAITPVLTPNALAQSSQSSPLDVRIKIDSPTHDGEYLQSDILNITIFVINTGGEPALIDYSLGIEQIETGSSNTRAGHSENDQMVAPGKNINYTITRPYPAGLWGANAVANIANGTGEDRDVRYFTTLTEQELFNKQALQQTSQYNLLLTIIGGISAAVAIGAAIINHRHNNRVRSDTKEHTKAQLELMQESNELTRSQLKLRDDERRALLGEPEIEIVRYTPETRSYSNEVMMYPNFKNVGKADSRNIKIHYRVFPNAVGLAEIVKHERDIKQNAIEVEGSIASGQSKNLETANVKNPAIKWEKKDKQGTHSVAVWYTYDYLDNEHGEILYNIQYTDLHPDNNPTRYTRSLIEQARAKLGSS